MPLFDKKDKSRYATFTRRSLGLGGGMALVFGILGGRLYQLQIRNGAQYMVEAEDNRVSERLIAPPRGRIMPLPIRATSRPIPPRPITPSVLPRSCTPSWGVHMPSRTSRSMLEIDIDIGRLAPLGRNETLE